MASFNPDLKVEFEFGYSAAPNGAMVEARLKVKLPAGFRELHECLQDPEVDVCGEPLTSEWGLPGPDHAYTGAVQYVYTTEYSEPLLALEAEQWVYRSMANVQKTLCKVLRAKILPRPGEVQYSLLDIINLPLAQQQD